LQTGFVFCGASADDTNFKLGDMDFVGLVGLEDPPKPGVLDAIKAIKNAGVRPVMVTGDHPTTAQAIAERIGIAVEGDENSCITGPVMSTMLPAGDEFNDAEDPVNVQEFWKEVVQHTTIFARVSPSHKRIIVQAYQHYGKNITAMTGDGVNDAPALKQAEVGVAMGIRGTEVAKEAADIVLLDDNLQSVVAGIEQGRLCSENLRKSILYTLCSKLPQVMPTFAELIGVPTALNVAQVLLIDIGTDIWTAIAFAWQPPESALMAVPPRNPRTERMVTGKVLAYSYGYIGVLQMVVCFFVFFHAVPHMWTMFESYEFKHVNDHALADAEENYRGMTAYYWTLVLGQVAAAMATTTTRESLFTYGLPNMMLNLCIVFELVFAAVVIYWRPAENTFKFRALDMTQAAWGMLGFGVIFIFEEVRKKCAAAKERQDKACR
jgi:sodium/potassium-transporting ATPase subunit alpha